MGGEKAVGLAWALTVQKFQSGVLPTAEGLDF